MQFDQERLQLEMRGQQQEVEKRLEVEKVLEVEKMKCERWCAAAKVASFDGLCELIVLEQFKDILPQRVATYVNEQKPSTAFRAAELADDFVLTHKGSFTEKYSRGDWKRGEDNGYARGGAKFSPGSSRRFVGPGRSEGARVGQCHYCREEGHWKERCPLLEPEGKPRSSSHAPAMCCSAVLVKKPQGVRSGMVPVKKLVCADLEVGSVFEPFITEAVVSMVGSDKYVPIKVLRDTAARYSFIVESVLPFSSETETGDFVLMRGMEMGLIPVQRHTVVLDCELVRGVVSIGVRPALPLDGVQMILGNDLAGSAVWAGVPPPVVISRPLASVEPDESGVQFPSVSPVYTVTRAQSRRMSTDLPVSESGKCGPARSLDFEIETKKKEKKERKPCKAKKRRPNKRRPNKRRPNEVGAPKRPMSAYMLWINASQPKEEWDSGGGGASSSPKKEIKKAGVKEDIGLSWIPLGPRLKGGAVMPLWVHQ
ncbi:hypothetical protein JOQ06_023085 [Pogonophryne albipinna]|uniref:CCHC-type domain-containing protein n=1 Tax=Pogonophryne albipinna TaxID=1090488 RepID=A0AAD6A9X5_9TELE|nr:hypothetical protein JOQ06_023085 [Pogonophryne albipinna]